MAFALHVDKLEDDGTIRVRHTFYGATEAECSRIRDEHGAGCKAFGPALDEGATIDEFEEIDDIPEWDNDDDGDDT